MCFRSSDVDKYPAARPVQYGNDYDRYLRDRDRSQKEHEKRAKQKKKKRNRNAALFTSNTAMMGGAGC